MTHQPWRYACEQGHRSWRSRNGDGYYCQVCQEHYDGELVDLKHE